MAEVCDDCPVDEPEIPPAPLTPAPVTVWCSRCDGPSDVTSEGPETDPHGTEWWVRVLDCGHEDASRVWRVGIDSL
jgi:hypothetical protein